MSLGWICPVCGTAKAPHIESCCTAALPQQAAASTAAPLVAEKKASRPSTSSKQHYVYEDKGFQEFWEIYPLKRGKAAAYRKWTAATAAGVPQQQIITAAKAYRDDPARDPQYTKWPEGWLSAGRWDDDYKVAAPPRTLASVGPDDYEAQKAARLAEEQRAIEALS